ncbi:MAG: Type II secretion system protein F [Lentisphaerae bacterium ADurb.BinA184]|nr:type II secretion system F family protein [Lentisphaerota bacterium]OPZ24943.1 MAG: Type II secretion system protein F [Lentisphaerae bacterium ADurb.BinA184]
MGLYRFRVSDPSGAVRELLIEGDSQPDATRRVQRRGLLPLAFLGEGAVAAAQQVGWRQRFDVVDFTDRLVPLLEANIPLERALGILGESRDEGFSTQLVNDLRRGLHEGRRFSELIRDRGRLFPRLYASIVEAGEEAGALPQVMAQLRLFLVESRELRSFLVSASVYPLFIIVAGVVMLGVVLGVIVPRFAGVLEASGGTVSTPTRLLIALSGLARGFWWLLPVVLLLAVVAVFFLRREQSAFRGAVDRWLLALPVTGRLVLAGNLARFARTMAILMRAGVHLLDTVGIASRVVQNQTLARSLVGLSGELRQGQRLSEALSQSRYIPPVMLRMVAVGEETGAVDTMLERVAERYEAEMKRQIKRLLSVFEPVVIICLGLAVGSVVMLMFLAIMNMQSAL